MGSIRGAALIAATAVLFLAGCGGSSSSSSTSDTANFKSDFTAVVSQFKGVSEGIGSTITTASNKTDAQLSAAFQQLNTRWTAIVNKLKSVTPPAKYSADFNQLKASATKVESDLKSLVAGIGSHSKSEAQAAAKSLINDIVAAKAAATRITNQLKSQS